MNKEKQAQKELIQYLYYTEKLSLEDISKELDIPSTSLRRLAKRFGIKIRTYSEAAILYLETHPDAYPHSKKNNILNNPEVNRRGREASLAVTKGKTYEEIFGVEKAKKLRQRCSERQIGEKNVNFGKKCPQHVCDAVSRTHKGKKQSLEHKIKRMRKAYEKMKMSPNKLEQRVIDIVNKNNIPFKFVGDGSLIIHGLCPDFVSTDKPKKLLEIFGDYFHSEACKTVVYHRTEEGRKKVFSDLGYEVLIIWEKDMKAMTDDKLLKIIVEFHNRTG